MRLRMLQGLMISLLLGGALFSGYPAEPAPDGLIPSPEAGWPQWRGLRRDGVSAEKGLLPVWPAGGPQLLWKRDNLGKGWSSPIVVNDTVYITGDVGDDLILHAFDTDGRPKRQIKNGRSWKKSYPGARTSAAYSEGVLYLMNAHGRVAAFDAATGAERWAVNVLERFGGKNVTWGMTECLLVDGPRVFVTPASPRTLMAALDKKTGETVWASEPIPNEELSYCSPILFRRGGRRLLTNCTSHHVLGVDADTGELLWRKPMMNKFKVTISTPVYGAGSVFYSTPDGPDGNLYRIGGDPPGSQVDHRWRTPVDALTGSGIYQDGLLFANGCKTIKTLHCIDWNTGETKYELPKLVEGRSGYPSAAMVWAEDRLYCLLEDGQALLLKPEADGFGIAGRFRLVEAKKRDAWGHPVLLDGRLYLRYHDTLWCYNVKAN